MSRHIIWLILGLAFIIFSIPTVAEDNKKLPELYKEVKEAYDFAVKNRLDNNAQIECIQKFSNFKLVAGESLAQFKDFSDEINAAHDFCKSNLENR